MAKRKTAKRPAKAVEVPTPAELAAQCCALRAQAKRLYAELDGKLEQLMMQVKLYDPITLKNGRVARVLPGEQRQAYTPKYELRVTDT